MAAFARDRDVASDGGRRVAIVQSCYLPWKGYFDLIASVDAFVIYDCVAYSRSGWRNRNRIKTERGTAWITVPVRSAPLGTPIDEIVVADRDAPRRHWDAIRRSYGAQPGYPVLERMVSDRLLAPSPERLSVLNRELLDACCRLLAIETPIHDARSFPDLPEDRQERLIAICRALGARRYLSGPAAAAYLDVERFLAAGIAVDWMRYGGYPEYDQPHPPFDHAVSIVDLVACTGEAARRYVRSAHGAPFA